jgi:hypothetical protein
MERFVLQKLIEWKSRADRKPLILNGARQVGKTWILRDFARREYAKEAYISCRKNELAREIFTKDFDAQRILMSLRALTSVDITPGDTLIILDEVQDIPEAIEALKYLYEQAPEYHIAVAGSLLGISLHQGVSYPVGKVDTLNMYPMDFCEFLLAKGEDQLYKLLESKDYAVINTLHERFTSLLREYYYVGGMPEVVLKYVQTGALQEVRRLQLEILKGYDMDFSKHAPSAQVPRLRMVWNSVPSQLFKENKKFIYVTLRSGARAGDFEMAIEWLIDSGLLYKVSRCTTMELPLQIHEDLKAFKIYMHDIGLLGAMADTDAKHVLIGDNVFSVYKGGMTELYVLQQMKANGISPIFYHSADNSRLEIDLVIKHDGAVLPIEVKAGVNVQANSLSRLLQENPAMQAVRFSMRPYIEQGQLTNIPLYAVCNLAK